ncbi:hypothetical protein CAC42_3160 [Sphaceloma murrayae]|uniref:Protein farnesyltransferase/geranylgeranyltransferase type-1 subunit alpha n=1 Tax=Sphaceloma murrayae TaxID=2082308 RepID=A0A2K1QRS7_9PEZI|nr:hypothetical protein CAC42_3160 [Sphaceloma murrayae]
MGQYTDDPKWADVTPFPQDDGGPNPLAAISYTEGYAEAMSYLRAVMAANEMSERALELTEEIIGMNPAHYTVWLYRLRIITSLPVALAQEIAWLNAIALRHQKNYQIWHHRQHLVDRIGSPIGEIAFVNRMLKGDAKNYHVWSYRQWLVRRFGLWDVEGENGRGDLDDDDEDDDEDDEEGQGEGPSLASRADHGGPPAEIRTRTTELEETALYIAQDVRNNSAWNHRFFIVNGDPAAQGVKDPAVYDREVAFAKEAIRKAPQNQSPWSYLKGIVDRAKGREGVVELKAFCEEFVEGQGEGKVRSSHALDLLAEIWGRERRVAEAKRAYQLLAERYDPIRGNYWNYLRGRLEGQSAA